MAEILDYKQLENSKIYVHPKSETLKFKHTLDYLEPFLQKFKDIQGIEWMYQCDDKVINEEKADVIEMVILTGFKSKAGKTIAGYNAVLN